MIQQQRTIVIIDDCPEDRAVYCRYLRQDRRYHYTIWEEEYGENGLKLCDRVKPDVVLLDFMLPDIDGLEVLQGLRAQPERHRSSAILLTGQGNEQVAVAALKGGAEDYLIKGEVTPVSLRHAIDSIIGRRQLEQKLTRARERRQLSAEIALRIRQCLNLADLLETTVTQVLQLLECDRVVVYQFQPNGRGQIVAESVVSPWKATLLDEVNDCCFQEGSGESYRQGKTRAIDNIDEANLSECHLQLLESAGVKASLIVPIILTREIQHSVSPFSASSSPQLWGLLVAHQCSDVRAWQTDELELLDDLAVQMAISIHQAQLFEELQREQQERERLLAILQASADFIGLADAEGKILWINERGKISLGLPADADLSQLRIADCHPPWALEIIQSQGRPTAIREGSWIGETAISTRDGGELPVSQMIVAHKDASGRVEYFSTVLRDIRDRKQIEAQLRASNERFRLAAAAVNCIIYDWDIEKDTVERTEGLTQVLGYTPEESGSTRDWWLQLIHPDDLARMREKYGEFVAPSDRSDYTDEYRIRHKNGQYIYVLDCAIVLRDENGIPRRAVGSTRDISDRKAAELEIRKALEKEQELNELKSRFVSMVSHEFRNPLNSISGMAQMLELYGDRLTDPKKEELFGRMQEGIERMVQLLDDVLIIGKADAGKLKFEPESLELETFCRSLLGEVQISAIETQKIDFVYQGETGAIADKKLLHHILVNLLSNALKYSPESSPVRFQVRRDRSSIRFEIEDFGIGIPPEDRLHLFESFHRARNVGKIKGTGLGLAIVKQCVELHGGQITVRSELGKGTIFIVTLPCI